MIVDWYFSGKLILLRPRGSVQSTENMSIYSTSRHNYDSELVP